MRVLGPIHPAGSRRLESADGGNRNRYESAIVEVSQRHAHRDDQTPASGLIGEPLPVDVVASRTHDHRRVGNPSNDRCVARVGVNQDAQE